MLDSILGPTASSDRLQDSLDYFLKEIVLKIQITKTQREKAENHYAAAADWLRGAGKSNLLYHLDQKLIPIGGLGTDTTTKPTKYDEYDLDLENLISGRGLMAHHAGDLYEATYSRFYESEVYRPLVQRMDRCIRLNYSGNFHIDFTSAVPFNPSDPSDTRVWVADKQKNGVFHPQLVDPVGLVNWLNEKAELQKVYNFDEARGSLEAMPILSDGAHKPILKQAIQLLKIARDIYFVKDDESKKILKSVLILTVAGESYRGQRSVAGTVIQTAIQIRSRVVDLAKASVLNPTNPSEDFAESLRRHPQRYIKLNKFLNYFISEFASLTDAATSFATKVKILEGLFGQVPTQLVMNEYGEKMRLANEQNRMRMQPNGLIGVGASTVAPLVRRHEFYGE